MTVPKISISFPVNLDPQNLVLCVDKSMLLRAMSSTVYESFYFISCYQEVEAVAFRSLDAIKHAASTTYLIKVAILKKQRVVILHFPDKMCAKLHAFLKDGRPKPGFCCGDFVNYLYGKYREETHNVMNGSEWDVIPFDEKNISSGMAIGLCENMETKYTEFTHYKFLHFAVYLGSKVYLSLFGDKSSLVFATMDQMQTFYSSKGVKVLKPIT